MERIFESLENLNVSEACFNEIMGIVEEYILELNKYEQYKVDKNPKLKKEIETRQEAMRDIGRDRKHHDAPYIGYQAIDLLADENRDALERDKIIDGDRFPKVSYRRPERFFKGNPKYKKNKAIRTEQSQRGSSKDVWDAKDPLMYNVRKAKGLTAKIS